MELYCKNGIKNFSISMIKLFRRSVDWSIFFFPESKREFSRNFEEFSPPSLLTIFLTKDSKRKKKKISWRKRDSQINLLGQCKQCRWGFHPSVTCGIGTLSDGIGTRQETFENGRAYSWLKRVHVKHFTVREEIRFCPSHSDNLLVFRCDRFYRFSIFPFFNYFSNYISPPNIREI